MHATTAVELGGTLPYGGLHGRELKSSCWFVTVSERTSLTRRLSELNDFDSEL